MNVQTLFMIKKMRLFTIIIILILMNDSIHSMNLKRL